MLPTFSSYIERLQCALSVIPEDQVLKLRDAFEERLSGGSSIYILGNGGSAANAHHITGDYTKTFALKRKQLRIECLSDNNCYITAAANDLDFSKYMKFLLAQKSLLGFTYFPFGQWQFYQPS